MSLPFIHHFFIRANVACIIIYNEGEKKRIEQNDVIKRYELDCSIQYTSITTNYLSTIYKSFFRFWPFIHKKLKHIWRYIVHPKSQIETVRSCPPHPISQPLFLVHGVYQSNYHSHGDLVLLFQQSSIKLVVSSGCILTSHNSCHVRPILFTMSTTCIRTKKVNRYSSVKKTRLHSIIWNCQGACDVNQAMQGASGIHTDVRTTSLLTKFTQTSLCLKVAVRWRFS